MAPPIALFALAFLAAACGGAVVETGADAGSGPRDGGRDAARERADDRPRLDATGEDDFPVFREDACPDVAIPPPPLECDPFAQGTKCLIGQACYPIPPRPSDTCQAGRYGTLCAPAGTGKQGAPCADGSDCAPGFICIKSGAGDQCVKLCRVSQLDSCSDGRICREIDVTGSGWGGCE